MKLSKSYVRMTEPTRAIPVALTLGFLMFAACKQDIEPPPPEDEPAKKPAPLIKPVEIDAARTITIKADRTITIPNVVFVIQHDSSLPESFGVTLTCTRPTVDGTRLTFGKFQAAQNLDALVKRSIDFASGATLDATGNGIFTATSAYQPKFAALKITSMDAQEVRGTLEGEFYRFASVLAGTRPTVMRLQASFVAALINK